MEVNGVLLIIPVVIEVLIRFRQSLVQSVNTVSIQLLNKIGLNNTLPKINKIFSLSKYRKVPQNYSLALGSFEISPFELTKLYVTFASRGKKCCAQKYSLHRKQSRRKNKRI